MGRLQGRNALVTGGARGLGEAQCQALVREGARVVIADIDVAAGDALAARINGEGGHALALELDVTNESQWERVMQLATEELGVKFAPTVGRRAQFAWACKAKMFWETATKDFARQKLRPSPSTGFSRERDAPSLHHHMVAAEPEQRRRLQTAQADAVGGFDADVKSLLDGQAERQSLPFKIHVR